MSFADLLRNARSRPVAVLQKFLVQYNPHSNRIHAFVEGTPDLAFYRNYLERYVANDNLEMYSCEGKGNVYDTYENIVRRFPGCLHVLFFVDKDLDDITGRAWPIDPRIYVTDAYSVENYLVNKDVIDRFVADFVKVKRVEFDFKAICGDFEEMTYQFQRLVLPLMSWILIMRRAGARPNLNGIDLDKMFVFTGSGPKKRRFRNRVDYLVNVTGVEENTQSWRQLLQTCDELSHIEPQRYIRGKFYAWFVLEFIRRLIAEIDNLARKLGGAVSVSAQLHESNCIQILVRGVAIPSSLKAFLNFHFANNASVPHDMYVSPAATIWARLRIWLRIGQR